jgi:hypothetical protein
VKRDSPLYPNKLLVLGVVILIAGGIFLLLNLGYLPQPGKLWPLPFLAAGMFLLYLVYLRGKTVRYIIPGMIMSLGGLYFLLFNTVLQSGSLGRIWPGFMCITGISLLPYGFRKKGAARTAITIPALFIVALSCFFLPFSLGAAGVSFLAFVREWWPLILVALGLALVVSFFSTRRPSSKV